MIYQHYGCILYGFILQFTSNESIAVRILKRSLDAIVEGAGEFQHSNLSLVTFFKHITRRVAITVLNEDKEKGGMGCMQPQTRLLQIADMLSPQHREVFCKCYYDGKDENLIADELRISEGEVKQKIRETAKALRDHL